MASKKQSQTNPDWEATKAYERLKHKWGAAPVPGLDARRAETIGLVPTVYRIGYAGKGTSLLPTALADKGVSARVIRRTAELMLQDSVVYKDIEAACRATNDYFRGVLRAAHIREEASVP